MRDRCFKKIRFDWRFPVGILIDQWIDNQCLHFQMCSLYIFACLAQRFVYSSMMDESSADVVQKTAMIQAGFIEKQTDSIDV